MDLPDKASVTLRFQTLLYSWGPGWGRRGLNTPRASIPCASVAYGGFTRRNNHIQIGNRHSGTRRRHPGIHVSTRAACAWIMLACSTALGIQTAPAQETRQETPIKIVALGTSLTAGFGLEQADGFVPQLQDALQARGLNVIIENAGVSGDTSAGGLARLDWSLTDDVDAVIIELGSNDALRGIDPQQTRANLSAILDALAARAVPALLTGMLAPPNLGEEYGAEFAAIYPELAGAYGVLFYPFFLEGVAAEAALNQPDGIHPNREGIKVIVEAITPYAAQLVAQAHKDAAS